MKCRELLLLGLGFSEDPLNDRHNIVGLALGLIIHADTKYLQPVAGALAREAISEQRSSK
jgi:hypothetical protein